MTWLLWLASACVGAACLAVIGARLMRSRRPRRILSRHALPRPA